VGLVIGPSSADRSAIAVRSQKVISLARIFAVSSHPCAVDAVPPLRGDITTAKNVDSGLKPER
jgi:hypothetical protein